SLCICSRLFQIAFRPTNLNPYIAPFYPPEIRQELFNAHDRRLVRAILTAHHQHAHSSRLRRLLRARRERPRSSRTAEQSDELAALHSITSSAATSSLSGTVRPSILAVETLMTSSNLLDCTTGRSAGFAPLRTRPV